VSLPAPARLLAALSRAFSARGWRWYVFGAQAVVAHGRPRLTADVDATVELVGATARDLVAMKILAGRRKDLEDVRGVLAEQRGRIDLARTRDVLASLEAAIGERSLLPRLDRLVRAAEARSAKKRER
jgi:hypothetical protein